MLCAGYNLLPYIVIDKFVILYKYRMSIPMYDFLTFSNETPCILAMSHPLITNFIKYYVYLSVIFLEILRFLFKKIY